MDLSERSIAVARRVERVFVNCFREQQTIQPLETVNVNDGRENGRRHEHDEQTFHFAQQRHLPGLDLSNNLSQPLSPFFSRDFFQSSSFQPPLTNCPIALIIPFAVVSGPFGPTVASTLLTVLKTLFGLLHGAA